MKTNYLLPISLILIIAAAVFSYLYFVPPAFYIVQANLLTHQGKYSFGGVENNFGNSTGTQLGRFGWQLRTTMNSDGSTNFDLCRSGQFVKHLDRA